MEQTRQETKISIPYTFQDQTFHIVGILSHYVTDLSDLPSKSPRNLALICHGALAHKDQTYHKRLAKALDIDSFRFDFRANHESVGSWAFAGFTEDLEDMSTVRSYLSKTFNYRVQLLIGHSRGALDSFAYLSKYSNDASPSEMKIPYLVSLSCRFRMHLIKESTKHYQESFDSIGYYVRKVKVAGEEKEVKIYPRDIEAFTNFPIAKMLDEGPSDTDILLVHGTIDNVVPTPDVGFLLNHLSKHEGRISKRRSGGVQLKLIEHGDHNFRGHYDEVVLSICDWFKERRELDSVPSSTSSERLEQRNKL